MQQLGLGLKAAGATTRRDAADLVRSATPLAAGRLRHLEAALANVTAMHAAMHPHEARAAASASDNPQWHDQGLTLPDYQEVSRKEPRSAAQSFRLMRNVQFKRLTCRACAGTNQLVLSIGTLPYLHFASGHTFFTQSLQVMAADGRRSR